MSETLSKIFMDAGNRVKGDGGIEVMFGVIGHVHIRNRVAGLASVVGCWSVDSNPDCNRYARRRKLATGAALNRAGTSQNHNTTFDPVAMEATK